MVLGVALEVLLTERLADLWPRGHEDSRVCAVDTGLPRPLAARDLACLVQLGRRFAEVPDIAACVLRVPVGRPLRKPTVEVEAIGDLGAANALNLLRSLRHRDDVVAALAVLLTGVHERRARLQGKPRVRPAAPTREAQRRLTRRGRRTRAG